MDDRQLKFEYVKNLKNNIWIALIATIGGTLSLMVSPFSIMKSILIVLGFILSSLLLKAYINQHYRLRKITFK